MTNKIFKSILLVSLSVFMAGLILVSSVFYTYLSNREFSTLDNQIQLAAEGVELDGLEYLKGLHDPGFRLTWIDPDGTVLYDSYASSDQMENHLERSEIQDAIKYGSAHASRYSSTLMERLYYSAVLLPDGTILRIATRQIAFWTILISMLTPILLIVILAALIALILAWNLSRQITKPLNSIDLDCIDEADVYDELTPMTNRLVWQQRKLAAQKAQLEQKKAELDALMANMEEGLVLLESDGTVVSANKAAQSVLGAQWQPSGTINAANCSRDILDLLDQARNSRHAQASVRRNGRTYEVRCTPVATDNQVSAIAMVILDVTEKEQAEQMRREFSANVSHELKTPLQTISGYSELMEQNLVQAQDISRFAGLIHNESQRMIHLISDIIRLSRLDENSLDSSRMVLDLKELAQAVAKRLEVQASKQDITLKVQGDSASLSVIPDQMDATFYNLIDNAIKYNKPHGTVVITTKDEPDQVIVQIADTGMGIPPEEQKRVFERFYRVDKSRSKQMGGTGLGLSIVKHAVSLHQGTIDLQSVPQEGTCITLTFPKAAADPSQKV